MSVAPGRQGVIAFFVTFCVCLVALAVALNVGWVVLTLRELVPLLLGSLVFAAIITGLILNTTFLVREIRRNEQHDAFVNAVTHELKTPVTSIRLHLETLKARGTAVDEAKRREFYDVMLQDSDRLLHLIEQVLSAGQKGRVPLQQVRIDLRELADECIALTKTQRHLAPDALRSWSDADERHRSDGRSRSSSRRRPQPAGQRGEVLPRQRARGGRSRQGPSRTSRWSACAIRASAFRPTKPSASSAASIARRGR